MNSNKEHWILCPGLRLQNAGTAAAGYCPAQLSPILPKVQA